jgi:hypothetical protein
MARILLGPLISDARGKQGGLVFSRNAAGHYTRAKVSPVQPRTADQIAIRAAITYLSQYWRDTMTPTMRTSWENYAKSTPLTDRFGAKVCVSGLAMFLRTNVFLRREGGPTLTTAPTLGGEACMQTLTLTASVANGVRITAIFPALLVGDFGYIGICTSPMSQARNYFSGPFRRQGYIDSATGFPNTIVQPASCAIGQRWFIECRKYEALGKVGPRWQGYVDVLA